MDLGEGGNILGQNTEKIKVVNLQEKNTIENAIFHMCLCY